MKSSSKLLVAIDTMIGNGGVSLWKDGIEIGQNSGDEILPMSQSVLPIIAELLEQNELKTRDITHLAVTVGPGSYTGIRVGISTSLGLQLATGCRLLGVSSLRVIASGFEKTEASRCVAAMYAGGGELVFQGFVFEKGTVVQTDSIELIKFEEITRFEKLGLFVDSDTYSRLKRENLYGSVAIESLGGADNVASILGRIASKTSEREFGETLTPIYTRSFNKSIN